MRIKIYDILGGIKMNIAICIDDNMGMLFNSRRQSRDKVLIEDFVKTAGENKIYIKPFSKILFENINVLIVDSPLEIAEKEDFCFIEDENIIPFSQQIEELIIYRWNRKYPADFHFEMPDGFVLKETTEFKGNSHETITREVYTK